LFLRTALQHLQHRLRTLAKTNHSFSRRLEFRGVFPLLNGFLALLNRSFDALIIFLYSELQSLGHLGQLLNGHDPFDLRLAEHDLEQTASIPLQHDQVSCSLGLELVEHMRGSSIQPVHDLTLNLGLEFVAGMEGGHAASLDRNQFARTGVAPGARRLGADLEVAKT